MVVLNVHDISPWMQMPNYLTNNSLHTWIYPIDAKNNFPPNNILEHMAQVQTVKLVEKVG